MFDEIKPLLPLVESLTELFYPFAEVAIHDLKEGKILALYNNISCRHVGDPTPLKELKVEIDQLPDRFPPYIKENWDGRKLKCVSVTVRNSRRQPIGLVCINVDIAFFEQTRQLVDLFLEVPHQNKNPVEQGVENAEEQIHLLIQNFLKQENTSLLHITRNQKKELVHFLYHKGVFNLKNASNLVAQALKLSRATIYNYLKELGN